MSFPINDPSIQASIADRVGTLLGATGREVVSRDLRRYYTVLEPALRDLRLTEAEAAAIVEALNGELVMDPWHGIVVAASVADALAGGLATKWRVRDPDALVDRLQHLPLSGAFALVDAVERFWATSNTDQPLSEQLRRVGLVG